MTRIEDTDPYVIYEELKPGLIKWLQKEMKQYMEDVKKEALSQTFKIETQLSRPEQVDFQLDRQNPTQAPTDTE